MAIDIEDLQARIGAMISATTEAVRELTARQFTGEAADGRIRATVTGGKELVEIRFAPRVTQELDNVALGEAVVEAINQAEDQAEEVRTGILRQQRPFGLDPEAFLRDPASFVPRLPDTFGQAGSR
jgi:DNA-binding protein YbaB